MAINKKLLHFKTFENFNSLKLSANETNTTYRLGVNGTITTGDPDVLYQSICWIKDTKQMWTHDTLYNCNDLEFKTINGESILGEGDLTIEVGAKVYTWNYDGESESVTLSQEEYDNIVEADIVIINFGGAMSIIVNKTGKELSESMGEYALTGQFENLGSKMYIHIIINISTKLATVTIEQQEIPTKTSQLENDSDFVVSSNLKTVMGKSIVGTGDIIISGSDIASIPATNIVKKTDLQYIKNNVWEVYSSQIAVSRANRFALLEDSEFMIETSTDAGSTWSEVAKTDDIRNIFSGQNNGRVSMESNSANQMRITITPSTYRYFMADWFYIWYSGPYLPATPTTVDIEYSTGSAPDTWLSYATNIPLEGQAGPNMIWYNKLLGSTTSNANVRFTIKNSATSNTLTHIIGIEAHGQKSYLSKNNSPALAQWDHLYTVGVNKNAIFPAEVSGTKLETTEGVIMDTQMIYALPSSTIDDADDTIVTKKTLKTINGENIVGTGNITISAGSDITEQTVTDWGFTKNAGTITGISANGTSIATSGVANIPAATTSIYGVTKLSSATNSTSTTLAATASAVKAAYDLANGKQEKLTSGTNIKTARGASILTSGDLFDSTLISTNTTGTYPMSVGNCYVYTVEQTTAKTFTLLAPTTYWNDSINIIIQTSSTITFSTNNSTPIFWANGTTPTFDSDKVYEISFRYTPMGWLGVAVAFHSA